jgi:antitoxin VapB
MDTAKVFVTGRSQAVRLPKQYRFDADEVVITKVGGVVVLFARDKAWDILADAVADFTDDFMADREQPPAAEERGKL